MNIIKKKNRNIEHEMIRCLSMLSYLAQAFDFITSKNRLSKQQ